MLKAQGLPKAKNNLEAFVDAGTIAKNVTFSKGSGKVIDGRNIVQAGSLVKGFLDTYNAKGTITTVPEEAQGIVLTDLDTTVKDASIDVMISGWINTDKLDPAVLTVTPEIKAALPKIGFIANGGQK